MTLLDWKQKINGKLVAWLIGIIFGGGVSYGVAITQIGGEKEKNADQEVRIRTLEGFVAGQSEVNKNIEKMLNHLTQHKEK